MYARPSLHPLRDHVAASSCCTFKVHEIRENISDPTYLLYCPNWEVIEP